MMAADEDDGGGGSDNTARDGDKGDDVRAAPNFLVRINYAKSSCPQWTPYVLSPPFLSL